MKFNSLKKVSVFLLAGYVLSACTSLSLMSKQAEIVNSSKETKVSQLVPALEFWYYKPIRAKDGAQLNSWQTDFYAFKFEKEGFYTEEVVKYKQGWNPGPLLDVIGYASIPVAIQMTHLDEPETFVYPAAFASLGVLQWIGARKRGFNKKYKGNIAAPKMKEKPKSLPGFKPLQLDEVTWKKGFDSHKQYYYPTYSQYLKKKATKSADYIGKPSVSPSNLANTLSYSLAKQGFRDSTLKIYSTNFTEHSLKAEVVGFEEHFIAGKVKYEIRIKWELYNNILERSIYQRTQTATTIWGYNKFRNWDLSQEMFELAFERSMYDFIFSSEVTTYLLKDEDPLAELYYTWSKISLGSGAKEAGNVAEAAKAVKTIITDKGHGTAVCFGKDGYLISNYHLIQKVNTDSVYVLFEYDKKLKAEVIRSNPIHDLVLIKVDTSFEYVLKPKPRNHKTLIGEKVFAIATPSDPDLIQSVSKGVISSERKANNRTVIQSDVSVNFGSSGGALVDEQGRLIGLLNAKLTGLGVEGLSFSTPAYYIKESLHLN